MVQIRQTITVHLIINTSSSRTPEFFCAIVVPDNGLCAGGDPNGDVQHDLKQFQNHHKGPQGNVRAVGRKRAVLHQQDIVDDSDDHDGHLRQKAGRAQCHDLLQQPPFQPETAEGQAERPASGQIGRTDAEADKLSQNGGIRRALDAHVQCENGHRVTDDIQHRPRQHGSHGVLGTAIRTDNGGHRILCKGQRYHRINDESIVVGQCQICVSRANQPKEAVSPDVADENERRTAQKGAEDAVAHAAVNVFGFVFPQGYAESRRRAVAEEQRNAPADDCDREDHTCGGIAQVAHAVAHKNLVNDVIQTGNNERKNTGDCEFQQQFSGLLCTQIDR